jgi:hypothetical protein
MKPHDMAKMSAVRPRSLICVFLMLLLSLFLLNCGGGGGDGDGGGGGTTLTPAAVDDTTAAEVVSMAFASAPLMDLDEEFDTLSVSSGTRSSLKIADWALRRAKEEIFSAVPYQVASSASESENCTTGNMTMNISWDGPQNATDCSQISNVNASMQFNQCSESGTYLNGTIYLHISGNLCNPSAMSMDFVNATIQNGGVNARMNSFSIDFSMSDDTTSATFNGDVSGSAGGVSEAMNFSDFNITGKETSGGESTTISGAISGSCFNGWVTLATVEPVISPYYGSCPTSGQVTVSGSGEVTVTFHSDYSATVGDTEYASCEDLPKTCQ